MLTTLFLRRKKLEEEQLHKMQVQKSLHMNGGVGDSSYAYNSLLQRTIMTKAKSLLEESVMKAFHDLRPQCFMMADMGCGCGSNAFLVVAEIINIIEEACQSLNHKAPQFGVYLNDLPGNDFNTLFNLLQDFYKRVEEEKGSDFRPYFVSATPGSFYERVFPDHFLHFVHSCYSVQWLSRVPKGLESNKGNVYIGKESPPGVAKAYYTQFEKDFTSFLRSRAREIVPGGRMVLTFLGSSDPNPDPFPIGGLLSSALKDMIFKGMIEEEKLDKFNIPMYTPTAEHVKQLIEAEASFILNNLETFTVDWSVDKAQKLENRAKFVAKTIRAVFESLLANAFDKTLMDDLFLRFETKVKAHLAKQTGEFLNISVSLTKI